MRVGAGASKARPPKPPLSSPGSSPAQLGHLNDGMGSLPIIWDEHDDISRDFTLPETNIAIEKMPSYKE